MKYYIQYEVDGFPGIQQAGPYFQSEMQSQFDDIAGFEGVKNVRIVSETDIPISQRK
jgi:hypothetical protein